VTAVNSPHACVGQSAPDFEVACVDVTNLAPHRIKLADYSGRWLILIFYPRDFSFVCPTELTAFSARVADFHGRDCELIGVSVDSIELHKEWLTTPESGGGLGKLQFPLASDADGAMAKSYGVWVDEKEVSTRGLFVIDPGGVLQYAVVHNLSVGRSADEILRVLDALRNGGLCPSGWTSADGTIDVERALLPGRVLGHYRIREKLGSGTFGTVFAAWDLQLERTTAIKILRKNVIESRGALLREARAVARLNHPNVCTIYTIEQEDGLPVIAMEYLDGQSLSDLMAAGLDRKTAISIAAQVASGLAAAHQENIVHGDLKPANVIFTSSGIAKILDFGLAMSLTGFQDSDQSTQYIETDSATETMTSPPTSARPSGIRGTPAYMSPEQAAGEPLTTASDTFSFGLLFFELLTGKPALIEDSVMKMILKLIQQDIGPELANQVDVERREMLCALLSRDPIRRPLMSEVATQLASPRSFIE
jgi:alkyl hydroperoxide reductase subunit AhpC/predicted Ser/Thr protein kinase